MFLGLDMFPRRLHLHFPSGKDKYQSVWGTIFSILILVIMIVAILNAFVIDIIPEEDSSSDSGGSGVASFTSMTPGGVSATELYPTSSADNKYLNVAFAVVYRKYLANSYSEYMGSVKAY